MSEPSSSLSHVRDVLLSAAECGSWLTLTEISKLTGLSDFNILARLTELRKLGFGIERRLRGYGPDEWVHEYLVKPPAGGVR